MSNPNWTAENIPNLSGKTILITGANSGLGLEAATILGSKGAEVIMAVRNLKKGEEALAKIKSLYPKAKVELMQIDLSDFDSIRNFANKFKARYKTLDVLMNNAGVMNPVKRELTKQGFEIQFGTNHLGHFLLTGLLLDVLKNTPGSRVVTQSSIMHKIKADIHFDDLNWEKRYDKVEAYSQSKLANLLFTYQLDNLLKANKINVIAVASHPGYTDTNLQNTSGFMVSIMNKLIAQRVDMGTLPILRAATEKELTGAEYFGPTKMMETRGYPQKVESSPKSRDAEMAKKLWAVSEKLTGFTYSF
jgi:NAD(P)-dependent dehydrogenase (short-subunit alcohol dehydrogenase family)